MTEKKTLKDRRKSNENGGRDQDYASTNQGIPEVTRTWKGQGRILLWSLQKEHGSATF